MSKYYVTHYQEYPLYEPAEGGYYYEGVAVAESIECNSLKEARTTLNNMIEEYGFAHDGFVKWNLNKWHKSSKYIGECEWVCIERIQGCEVTGKQVYC